LFTHVLATPLASFRPSLWSSSRPSAWCTNCNTHQPIRRCNCWNNQRGDE